MEPGPLAAGPRWLSFWAHSADMAGTLRPWPAAAFYRRLHNEPSCIGTLCYVFALTAWLALLPALFGSVQLAHQLHHTDLHAIANRTLTTAVPEDFLLTIENGTATALPPRGYRVDLPESLYQFSRETFGAFSTQVAGAPP